MNILLSFKVIILVHTNYLVFLFFEIVPPQDTTVLKKKSDLEILKYPEFIYAIFTVMYAHLRT